MSNQLTPEQARARLIKRSDMVACEVAFIDCKMPGSERKQNFSLVGPGVTQSRDQVVNLTEAHGFSLGVAAMPPGTVNNLHIHFTAEVFMIQRGTWTFRWGAEGRDGEIVGNPGDIVSIPTWIFRGFSNTGDKDGWIFTALGGDDTGGIVWHPSILQTASKYGLYLTADNMLVDTGGAPPAAPLMPALTEAQIATLPRYTPAQMQARVVQSDGRAWSARALLDSALPGHGSALAPVIGHGMSEDRAHAAPIAGPHGFSIEWLRVEPGNAVGRHMLGEKQVAIVMSGALRVVLNAPNDVAGDVPVEVGTGEVFSVPAGTWRTLACAGDVAVEAVLVTAGDHRKRIAWAAEVAEAAMAAGIGLDHDGHVAPLDLLPPPTRTAAVAQMMAAAAE